MVETQTQDDQDWCDRCHMNLLPVELYPGVMDAPGQRLCEVCANTYDTHPETRNPQIIGHLIYAKLLELERKIDELALEEE